MKRLRLTLLVAAVVAALALFTVPAQASSAGWLVKCPLFHTNNDDPIKFPGQVGVSHLHEFFANRSTDAFSTYASMVVSTSTCGTSQDTAGYWAPALYKDGVRVPADGKSVTGRSTRQQFYYRDDNLAAGTVIEPFPEDFRMIAGNSHATSEAENPYLGREIYWGCADNNDPPGKQTEPNFACPGTGIISLHMGFPNCWDGVLTHVDDTDHMRYPSGGVCPEGFPHTLPRLIQRFEYPVGTDDNTGRITLASGAYYTTHSDFWNTWQQPALVSLVDRCLNLNVACGTNPVP